MKTLDLTTSRQFHLDKNAAPALAAIHVAIEELLDACNVFSGTNDNRAEIERWAEAITERVASLLQVDGEDAAAKAASLARHEQSAHLYASLAQIEKYVPAIYSEEEGSRPLLKKIRRRTEDSRSHLREFESGKETREVIIRDVEKVTELVGELLIADEQMDRWPASRVTQACNAFVQALREPLRTEPLAPPESRTVYLQNRRFGDELDELIRRLSGLGVPKLGGVEEGQRLAAKARSIRALTANFIFEEHPDTTEIHGMLQEVQRDLRSLAGLRSATSGDVGFMASGLAYAEPQMHKVLAMFKPHASSAPEQTLTGNVMATLGRAFAWGN